MPDVFVNLLNKFGYQPVFLPRTGYVPPELYTFANHKLIRHGTLNAYMAKPFDFQTTAGELADIEGKITSSKNVGASVGFLTQALSVLGLGSLPKLDLSFTGSREFVFAFTGVKYKAVDPAVLDPVLQGMKIPDAISEEHVMNGDLHIAYEYAYATGIKMSRADGQEFSTDITGLVGTYIDLGTKVKVEVNNNTTISFVVADKNTVAAFAYKAGRLMLRGKTWVFEPEVVRKIAAAKMRREPFMLAKGFVLKAEEQPVAVAA